MQWDYSTYIQAKEAISFEEPLIYPFQQAVVGPDLTKHTGTCSPLSAGGSRRSAQAPRLCPAAARSDMRVGLPLTGSSPSLG